MTTTPRPRFPWPFPESLGAVPDNQPSPSWRDSVISDKAEWQATFEDLFNGAGSATYLARAERLAGYGFAPHDLREACANPRSVASFPDSEQRPEADVEAFAALAHEAALYYSTGYGMAREAELGYARRLTSLGWSLSQVGSLLGVTKQRVSKLLRQKRTSFGPFPSLAKKTHSTEVPEVRLPDEPESAGERSASDKKRLESIYERQRHEDMVTMDGRTVGELNAMRRGMREERKHERQEGRLESIFHRQENEPEEGRGGLVDP